MASGEAEQDRLDLSRGHHAVTTLWEQGSSRYSAGSSRYSAGSSRYATEHHAVGARQLKVYSRYSAGSSRYSAGSSSYATEHRGAAPLTWKYNVEATTPWRSSHKGRR